MRVGSLTSESSVRNITEIFEIFEINARVFRDTEEMVCKFREISSFVITCRGLLPCTVVDAGRTPVEHDPRRAFAGWTRCYVAKVSVK